MKNKKLQILTQKLEKQKLKRILRFWPFIPAFFCLALLVLVKVPQPLTTSSPDKTYTTNQVPLYQYLLFFKKSKATQAIAQKQAREGSLKALSILEIKAFDFTPFITGWGDVQPSSGSALILYNEVSAKVKSLADISIGDTVKKGDVIITLDDREVRYALTQAEAKLKELEASLQSAEALLPLEKEVLKVAENAYARYQDLAEKNVTSSTNLENQLRTYIQAQQAVQNYKNNIATLKAQILNQQAAVDQALYNLEKTQIKAPVDGRVLEIMVQEGQYLNSNTSTVRMVNLNELIVKSAFPFSKLKSFLNEEESLASLKGNVASFSLTEGEFSVSWPLILSSMPAELSAETRDISLLFDFKDSQNTPLLGSFGQVYLKASTSEKALLIPRDSLKNGSIYLLDENNKIYRQEVRYSFIGEQWAWVTQGLKEGDRLVVHPPIPFVEGREYKPLTSIDASQKLEDFIQNSSQMEG